MSITVSFTTSSKRENSTKRLYMSKTYDCTFKNGCSMLNPTLLLELETPSFPAYTAFKIGNRYYNVRDIRSVRNNLFEIDGKIDVLATFKANILATTAYVIYDSISNTELPDSRLPMITTKSVSVETVDAPFHFDAEDSGTYILSLTGAHNSTGIYKVTEGELSALINDISYIYNKIFDYESSHPAPTFPQNPTVDTVLAYWAQYFAWLWGSVKYPIVQAFGSGSIPDNIRECKYIPFNVGTTGQPTTVYLGTFETNQQLKKLVTNTITRNAEVDIPWPKINNIEISDYRRRSPYTELYLYLPYIGITKLSSENLVGYSKLSIDYALSVKDGDMTVTVSAGDEVIGQYSGNVAISVPVGMSNINIPKASQSIIAGATAGASGNIGGAGMAAIQFAESITPNFSCIGGLDGMASLAANQKITCYCVFHDTIVPPNSQLDTIGSPTMAPKSLSTLTGYVQTMSASVSGSMTSEERNLINTLLDNGIYIEGDEEPPQNVNN